MPTQSQGSVSQPFGYTGEQQDPETSLVYLRARMYDPSIGRFLQRDPWAGTRAVPATLNRYAYTLNNPVNAVDPSGQRTEIWDTSGGGGWIGLAVVGALGVGAYETASAVGSRDLGNSCTGSLLAAETTGNSEESVEERNPEQDKLLSSGEGLLPNSIWRRTSRPGTYESQGVTPQGLRIAAPLGLRHHFSKAPAPHPRLRQQSREIRKLQREGVDIHELKGGEHASQRDLYKDRKGNIYVKPKGGSGPGDPTGLNINEF